MGSWRGVDIENEIGRLANDFVAEIDGKPEVNHGFLVVLRKRLGG